MSTPQQRPHKSEQSVATPLDFIEAVENRFGKLTIDLAADATNTKCDRYINEDTDSLKSEWKVGGKTERFWLNPPFGKIAPWVSKCAFQKLLFEERDELLLLVPASIGANWFWDSVAHEADVYALTPRIQFVGHTAPYPKDLILAVYNKHSGGVFKRWEWRS